MTRADAPAPPRARDAAPLFAALGDETRLALLIRLSTDGPASMASLGAESRVSRQAVAKHVRVLCDAGLVKTSRRGRERVCEMNPDRLEDAHAALDGISRQWDAALTRLKKFVEG